MTLDKLWTAPELLEVAYPPLEGTKKGDVYSFAIIAQEILYQRGVFFRPEDSYSPEGKIVSLKLFIPKKITENTFNLKEILNRMNIQFTKMLV